MLDSTTKTRAKSADAPVGAVPPPPRLRRRPLLIVLAVALVAVGALVGVWLWNASSTGADVVVVRAAVGRGEVIVAADLGTARVGVDPALRTVPASALQGLVGQPAQQRPAAQFQQPLGSLAEPLARARRGNQAGHHAIRTRHRQATPAVARRARSRRTSATSSRARICWHKASAFDHCPARTASAKRINPRVIARGNDSGVREGFETWVS